MVEITKPVTHENVEHLLDSGLLYVGINNGAWWLARRNGKTKKWRKEPERYEIPYKVGFRRTGRLSQVSINDNRANNYCYYRHKDDVPEKRLVVKDKPVSEV